MKIIHQNKKARFNFFITEEVEAGICLLGSEVKSIRAGKVNLADSYIVEMKSELQMINSYIGEYKGANRFNHAPMRMRKILLNKKQIKKYIGKIVQKGFSLIPLSIYINDNKLYKLKLLNI